MSARIDNGLHQRFCLVSTRFGVSDTQMITDALEALCDYAISRGKYERPMKMVFDEEQAAHLMGMVAEAPPSPTPPEAPEPARKAIVDTLRAVEAKKRGVTPRRAH